LTLERADESRSFHDRKIGSHEDLQSSRPVRHFLPRGAGEAVEDLVVMSIDDVVGGRYSLTRLLGHGGMSDVYEALDESSQQAVAVKVVRSADPELPRRFAQEVRALALIDHPGLVRL